MLSSTALKINAFLQTTNARNAPIIASGTSRPLRRHFIDSVLDNELLMLHVTQTTEARVVKHELAKDFALGDRTYN